MLKGTDVSGYQSDVVPNGDFTIVKLSEGSKYVNSKAAAQIASARSKGELVGFYHYPNFSQTPKSNSDLFRRELELYYRPGDIVALDHEYPPDIDPGPTVASAWGRQFLAEISDYNPWVYSNLSWAADGHCAGMGDRPWWKAWPHSTADFTVRGPFKRCVMHQYAETNGIDRDYFNGTKQDWLALSTDSKELEMYGGFVGPEFLGPGKRRTVSHPRGAFKAIGFVCDSTTPQEVRLAMHNKAGHGKTVVFTVGGPTSTTDSWPEKHVESCSPDMDWFSIENHGTEEIGWDAS